MRFTALFPFLCAVAAFVLSLLCIFAGSKRGFLENADILTLNTSMFGEILLNSSSSSSFLSTIAGDIKGDVNGVINDVAKELNIHDFYSAYILDYCEGYYTPTAVSNKTEHPSKNVTNCSNHTALFHFDPTAILQSELRTGINLSELHWPSEIKDAVTAIEVASKAMFVCYCIGAAFAGLAFLGAIFGLLSGSRLSSFLNFFLDLVAFLALGIASAISTAIATKVVNAVHKFGTDIGITAYKGKVFMGMTWAATALMLLASLAWIFECCLGRKKQTSYMKEGKTGRR